MKRKIEIFSAGCPLPWPSLEPAHKHIKGLARLLHLPGLNGRLPRRKVGKYSLAKSSTSNLSCPRLRQ
jgi:hypothetical protein